MKAFFYFRFVWIFRSSTFTLVMNPICIQMSVSTIEISESTIEGLDYLRIYPDEKYGEIIERLITLFHEEEELTSEEWSRIQKSEEEYDSGDTYSLEEVRQRVGDK